MVGIVHSKLKNVYVCNGTTELIRNGIFDPLVPGDFFLSLLMKVHTEVHYGNRLGNPKYQVSAFIHYQDMEIF